MKKIIFIMLVCFGYIAKAQVFTPMTAAGYQNKRTKTDSTNYIPTFSGIPNLRSTTAQRQAAIAADSTGKNFYWYDPKTQTWNALSGLFDTTNIYNAIQNLYNYFSDTSWTNQFQPFVGVIQDTTIRLNDSTIRYIYTDGTQVDDTSRIAFNQTNIDYITNIVNYIDSLRGEDTTFVLSPTVNGSPFAYAVSDPLSRNDTLHFYFPPDPTGDSVLATDANGNLIQKIVTSGGNIQGLQDVINTNNVLNRNDTINNGGNQLRFISTTASNVIFERQVAASSNAIRNAINIMAKSTTSNTFSDGFGPFAEWENEALDGTIHNLGGIAYLRDSSDNSGRMVLFTYKDGITTGGRRMELDRNGLVKWNNYTDADFYKNDTINYKPLVVADDGTMYRGSWAGSGGTLQQATDASIVAADDPFINVHGNDFKIDSVTLFSVITSQDVGGRYSRFRIVNADGEFTSQWVQRMNDSTGSAINLVAEDTLSTYVQLYSSSTRESGDNYGNKILIYPEYIKFTAYDASNRAVRVVLEHVDTLDSPPPYIAVFDGDTLKKAAYPTGGGGISSVVAGTGIDVDNTDPANPVVSATGEGGVTLYTGDGALSGNRIVNLNGVALSFNQGSHPFLLLNAPPGFENSLLQAITSTPSSQAATTIRAFNNAVNDGNEAYERYITSETEAKWYVRTIFNDGVKLVEINASATNDAATLTYTADTHTFNGQVKIVDGTQAEGYVFTSDADGLGSWQLPTTTTTGGYSLSYLNIDSTNSFAFIGDNANSNSLLYLDWAFNTAVLQSVNSSIQLNNGGSDIILISSGGSNPSVTQLFDNANQTITYTADTHIFNAQKITISTLPSYNNNSDAISGGLSAGDLYRISFAGTSTVAIVE